MNNHFICSKENNITSIVCSIYIQNPYYSPDAHLLISVMSALMLRQSEASTTQSCNFELTDSLRQTVECEQINKIQNSIGHNLSQVNNIVGMFLTH